jgi:hypothetical protein
LNFGSLELEGIKIEIMEDIRKKVNDAWEEPVDLEYEYEVYMKMDRDLCFKIRAWYKSKQI